MGDSQGLDPVFHAKEVRRVQPAFGIGKGQKERISLTRELGRENGVVSVRCNWCYDDGIAPYHRGKNSTPNMPCTPPIELS